MRDGPGCGLKHLDLLRTGLGLALIASVGPLTPHLPELYGDQGWVSREAFAALSLGQGWYSVLAWCSNLPALVLLHTAFLAAIVAFTAGYGVRWVKWPIWLLYVSYLNRNPAIVYGPDLVLASLLILVCIAPSGSAPVSGIHTPAGARAVVCLLLIRLQMTAVFFFTAVEKLRGELWWTGEAVWVVVNNVEFAHAPVAGLLAEHVWMVNLATYGTLFLELSYPFLIWNATTRPWMLGAAILFHLGTAGLLGLYLFAWVAIVGHLSFLPDTAVAAFAARFRLLFRSTLLKEDNRVPIDSYPDRARGGLVRDHRRTAGAD